MVVGRGNSALGRDDAHNRQHGKNSHRYERCRVPSRRHALRLLSTRFLSLTGVLPAATQHKSHGSALGVRGVTRANVVDLLAAAHGAKVGQAQAQGLVAPGSRRGPCGDLTRGGDHRQRVLSFDGLQAREGDGPRSGNVDNDDVAGIYNHHRSPVEHPSAHTDEGEQGAVVEGPADIGTENEPAHGGQHQGKNDNGHGTTERGAEDGSRLFHGFSMTQGRGGESDGDRA